MATTTAPSAAPEHPKSVATAEPTGTGTGTAAATTEPEAGDQAAPHSPPPASAGILPASHWQQRADDENESDSDSAYADSIASSTASLSASILEYRTLHGRTYHSERGEGQSWCVSSYQPGTTTQ